MSTQASQDLNNPKTPIKPEKPQLAIHEWLAVVIIIGCFTMITSVSIMFDAPLPENNTGIPHYLKPQYIEVLIQGAIESPGSYKMNANAKLYELLAIAKPSPEADLKLLKSESKLRNGQVVKVPAKQYIYLHVTGAVENPGKIRVRQGTKLNEIGKYVQLSSHADGNKINRKRILKSEEVVVVPSR